MKLAFKLYWNRVINSGQCIASVQADIEDKVFYCIWEFNTPKFQVIDTIREMI